MGLLENKDRYLKPKAEIGGGLPYHTDFLLSLRKHAKRVVSGPKF